MSEILFVFSLVFSVFNFGYLSDDARWWRRFMYLNIWIHSAVLHTVSLGLHLQASFCRQKNISTLKVMWDNFQQFYNVNDAYEAKKKYRRRREAHSNFKSSEKKMKVKVLGSPAYSPSLFFFCLFLMTPALAVSISLSLQLPTVV